MPNTIYLYVEHYGSAWEPAEGGCFVETSFIEEETMEELHRFGEALQRFNERAADLMSRGFKVTGTDYSYGFDADGFFNSPETEFDRDGCVGSGLALRLSLNEPKGKTYDGYQ